MDLTCSPTRSKTPFTQQVTLPMTDSNPTDTWRHKRELLIISLPPTSNSLADGSLRLRELSRLSIFNLDESIPSAGVGKVFITLSRHFFLTIKKEVCIVQEPFNNQPRDVPCRRSRDALLGWCAVPSHPVPPSSEEGGQDCRS